MSVQEDRKKELAPLMEEFGALVWLCQIVERSLGSLLVLLLFHFRDISDADKSDARRRDLLLRDIDIYSKKTFAELNRLINRVFPVPELTDLLEESRRTRNRLVHEYMLDCGSRILDPIERFHMLDEFKQMRVTLSDASAAISGVKEALMEKFGVEDTYRADMQRINALWEQLNPDPLTSAKH